MGSRDAAGTVPELLARASHDFAERVAIEDGGVTMTFRELADAARRAARAFIAAGVEPFDRVAIWAPNIWEWIVVALGAECAGAALVPLNTRFKAPEAGYVLRASRAKVLCSVGEFLGTSYAALLAREYGGSDGGRPFRGLEHLERLVSLRGEAPGATSLRDFLEEGSKVSESAADARSARVDPGDVLDILFTSGTTGNPKGVVTTHAQNLRAFTSWTDVTGLREGDRYLIVNPFFHAFGYKAGWLSCLIRGATILPQAVFDAGDVLARIARDRVTVLPGPPTLYHGLLGHPELGRFDLTGLRLAVTGAASIPVELVRRMKEDLGFATVITGYGLTEACGIVTMCRFDDDLETIATTSGRAIPGVEVRTLKDDGSDAAVGEPGEVVVRGYNVMKGYFEAPERTAEAIDARGFLHTGDIGVLDGSGNLRITDRKKDMFIVGGFNCYPAEIEDAMSAHPAILQAAVVGVPDPRLGEVGASFVVLRPGKRATPEEIIAFCRERMANYKVPRTVEIVASLPTNAGGKVTKFVLRERAASRAAGTSGA